MSSCRFLDPLDCSRVYDSRKTVLIAFAQPEVQRSNRLSLTQMRLDVLDAYRDPTLLLPRLFEFPCFLRLMDYRTYKVVEESLRAYVRSDEAKDLIPTLVYPGYEDCTLIDNPAVINVATIHPTCLRGFLSLMRETGKRDWP